MDAIKLSISLAEEDVEVLDRYVKTAGVASRSAAIQEAIQMLRYPALEDAYAAAWDEWQASGEASAWDVTTGDGLVDAPR